MLWRDRQRIFQASGQHGWINSHAQVPTVWVKDERTLRIYFATRQTPGQSLTTFIDVDAADPARVLHVHDASLLPLGAPGSFDEHGIMPSSLVANADGLRLYYSGWSRAADVPYINLTGVALSRDGARFEKASDQPVLVRTAREPWSATSPCVRRLGAGWIMWYCSGTAWLTVDGRPEHQYDIKSATSDDGLHWTQAGAVCLPCGADEALTRPTVCCLRGRWHMWFCHRRMGAFRDGPGSYRIGYAWSDDAEHWTRDDAVAGLHPASEVSEGWDSTMVAYPEVVPVGERLLMFYNGNGFGQGGLGYAWCDPGALDAVAR